MLRQKLFRKRILSFIVFSVVTLIIVSFTPYQISTVYAAPQRQASDAQRSREARAPQALRSNHVQTASTLADIDGSPVDQPFMIHIQASDSPNWNPSVAYKPDQMEYLVV